MWFIGVEVEQETSAPPPKKILDPPLRNYLKKDKKVIKIPARRSEANLLANVFTRVVENSNSGLPSS